MSNEIRIPIDIANAHEVASLRREIEALESASKRSGDRATEASRQIARGHEDAAIAVRRHAEAVDGLARSRQRAGDTLSRADAAIAATGVGLAAYGAFEQDRSAAPDPGVDVPALGRYTLRGETASLAARGGRSWGQVSEEAGGAYREIREAIAAATTFEGKSAALGTGIKNVAGELSGAATRFAAAWAVVYAAELAAEYFYDRMKKRGATIEQSSVRGAMFGLPNGEIDRYDRMADAAGVTYDQYAGHLSTTAARLQTLPPDYRAQDTLSHLWLTTHTDTPEKQLEQLQGRSTEDLMIEVSSNLRRLGNQSAQAEGIARLFGRENVAPMYALLRQPLAAQKTYDARQLRTADDRLAASPEEHVASWQWYQNLETSMAAGPQVDEQFLYGFKQKLKEYSENDPFRKLMMGLVDASLEQQKQRALYESARLSVDRVVAGDLTPAMSLGPRDDLAFRQFPSNTLGNRVDASAPTSKLPDEIEWHGEEMYTPIRQPRSLFGFEYSEGPVVGYRRLHGTPDFGPLTPKTYDIPVWNEGPRPAPASLWQQIMRATDASDALFGDHQVGAARPAPYDPFRTGFAPFGAGFFGPGWNPAQAGAPDAVVKVQQAVAPPLFADSWTDPATGQRVSLTPAQIAQRSARSTAPVFSGESLFDRILHPEKGLVAPAAGESEATIERIIVAGKKWLETSDGIASKARNIAEEYKKAADLIARLNVGEISYPELSADQKKLLQHFTNLDLPGQQEALAKAGRDANYRKQLGEKYRNLTGDPGTSAGAFENRLIGAEGRSAIAIEREAATAALRDRGVAAGSREYQGELAKFDQRAALLTRQEAERRITTEADYNAQRVTIEARPADREAAARQSVGIQLAGYRQALALDPLNRADNQVKLEDARVRGEQSLALQILRDGVERQEMERRAGEEQFARDVAHEQQLRALRLSVPGEERRLIEENYQAARRAARDTYERAIAARQDPAQAGLQRDAALAEATRARSLALAEREKRLADETRESYQQAAAAVLSGEEALARASVRPGDPEETARRLSQVARRRMEFDLSKLSPEEAARVRPGREEQFRAEQDARQAEAQLERGKLAEDRGNRFRDIQANYQKSAADLAGRDPGREFEAADRVLQIELQTIDAMGDQLRPQDALLEKLKAQYDWRLKTLDLTREQSQKDKSVALGLYDAAVQQIRDPRSNALTEFGRGQLNNLVHQVLSNVMGPNFAGPSLARLLPRQYETVTDAEGNVTHPLNRLGKLLAGVTPFAAPARELRGQVSAAVGHEAAAMIESEQKFVERADDLTVRREEVDALRALDSRLAELLAAIQAPAEPGAPRDLGGYLRSTARGLFTKAPEQGPSEVPGMVSSIGDYLARTGPRLFGVEPAGYSGASFDDLVNLPGRAAPAVLNDLPFFGDGGVVTKATIAVIGEKEPEVVVPLSKIGASPTLSLDEITRLFAGRLLAPEPVRLDLDRIGQMQQRSTPAELAQMRSQAATEKLWATEDARYGGAPLIDVGARAVADVFSMTMPGATVAAGLAAAHGEFGPALSLSGMRALSGMAGAVLGGAPGLAEAPAAARPIDWKWAAQFDPRLPEILRSPETFRALRLADQKFPIRSASSWGFHPPEEQKIADALGHLTDYHPDFARTPYSFNQAGENMFVPVPGAEEVRLSIPPEATRADAAYVVGHEFTHARQYGRDFGGFRRALDSYPTNQEFDALARAMESPAPEITPEHLAVWRRYWDHPMEVEARHEGVSMMRRYQRDVGIAQTHRAITEGTPAGKTVEQLIRQFSPQPTNRALLQGFETGPAEPALRALFGLPQFAEGGLVTDPTPAIYGEAGAEAKIPLAVVIAELQRLAQQQAAEEARKILTRPQPATVAAVPGSATSKNGRPQYSTALATDATGRALTPAGEFYQGARGALESATAIEHGDYFAPALVAARFLKAYAKPKPAAASLASAPSTPAATPGPLPSLDDLWNLPSGSLPPALGPAAGVEVGAEGVPEGGAIPGELPKVDPSALAGHLATGLQVGAVAGSAALGAYAGYSEGGAKGGIAGTGAVLTGIGSMVALANPVVGGVIEGVGMLATMVSSLFGDRRKQRIEDENRWLKSSQYHENPELSYALGMGGKEVLYDWRGGVSTFTREQMQLQTHQANPLDPLDPGYWSQWVPKSAVAPTPPPPTGGAPASSSGPPSGQQVAGGDTYTFQIQAFDVNSMIARAGDMASLVQHAMRQSHPIAQDIRRISRLAT